MSVCGCVYVSAPVWYVYTCEHVCACDIMCCFMCAHIVMCVAYVCMCVCVLCAGVHCMCTCGMCLCTCACVCVVCACACVHMHVWCMLVCAVCACAVCACVCACVCTHAWCVLVCAVCAYACVHVWWVFVYACSVWLTRMCMCARACVCYVCVCTGSAPASHTSHPHLSVPTRPFQKPTGTCEGPGTREPAAGGAAETALLVKSFVPDGLRLEPERQGPGGGPPGESPGREISSECLGVPPASAPKHPLHLDHMKTESAKRMGLF